MLKAVPGEVLRGFKGPGGRALGWERESLVGWRSLAVWSLHHGVPRGDRGALGVWGEVLGLVEKGRVWKG